MKIRVNISLDDVCPHKHMGLDAVHRLVNIIDYFPCVKISLFVPTKLRRLREGKKYYCILDYPKFIDGLLSLPQKNFEICYHGHAHCNKKRKSNNDEFRDLKTIQCLDLLNQSKEIFDQAGIPVRPVFRPPGFWLNPKSFRACKEFGIKVLALGQNISHFKYKGENKRYDHVVYVGPQPSCKTDIEILFHANRKAKDCFNDRAFKKILKHFNENEKRLQFIHMEEFHGSNR